MDESKKPKVNSESVKRFNEYDFNQQFLPEGADIVMEHGNNWFEWTYLGDRFISHYWTDGHRGSINHCKLN